LLCAEAYNASSVHPADIMNDPLNVTPANTNVGESNHEQFAKLRPWLSSTLAHATFKVETAYADSNFFANSNFPSYFRITSGEQTFLVTAAPATSEQVERYIRVTEKMCAAGVHVPQVVTHDCEQGFLLLNDPGSNTALDQINDAKADTNADANADGILRWANETLVAWQRVEHESFSANLPASTLPSMDAARLRRELAVFESAYLDHPAVALTKVQLQTHATALSSVCDKLIAANLAQANVLVHGDFALRNLVVPDTGDAYFVVLNFFDAAIGPISYDVASLYRDIAISWEEDRVLDGVIRYWEKARKAKLPVPEDFADYYRDVEWMGLQRHLWFMGRLVRAGATGGAPLEVQRSCTELQRFAHYVRKVAERYPALFPLVRLFDALKIDDGVTRVTGYTF
jgi:N-acetylmuramate 1-kinase